MNIKKLTGVLIALVLILPMLFQAMPVSAASELSVSHTVTPDTLTAPGKVDLEFDLTNKGDVFISDLQISGPGIESKTLGNIDIGSSRHITVPSFNVTEARLGVQLSFKFAWTENGTSRSLVYPVTIGKKAAKPDALINRTLSKSVGAPGETITVSYAIENTGDTDLTDIKVVDFGDVVVGEGISLKAGASVHRFDYQLTLSETVESKPTMTAKSSDGSTLTKSVSSPITVTVANSVLDVTVTQGIATAEGVPLNILIKNIGNIKYNSLMVTDEKGVVITQGTSIAGGGELTFTHVITDAPRDVTITAKGMPELTGATEQSFSSVPVTVAAYAPPEEAQLLLEITPSQMEIEQAGVVELEAKITNTGAVDMKNVQLTEKGMEGILWQAATLAPGTKQFKLTINAAESMNLEFAIKADGQEPGVLYETKAPAVITLKGEAAPEDQPKKGNPMLLYIVIGLGVLLIVAIVVLAVLLAKDAKRKERESENEEMEQLLEGDGGRKERKRLEREIDRTFDEPAPRKSAKAEKEEFMRAPKPREVYGDDPGRGGREQPVSTFTRAPQEPPRRTRDNWFGGKPDTQRIPPVPVQRKPEPAVPMQPQQREPMQPQPMQHHEPMQPVAQPPIMQPVQPQQREPVQPVVQPPIVPSAPSQAAPSQSVPSQTTPKRGFVMDDENLFWNEFAED